MRTCYGSSAVPRPRTLKGHSVALQNIEFGNPTRRFPLALLPISKSNDVSRAVGWGSVYKQDFKEEHVIPDLLSAIAAAPPVNVDCWNVRIMTSDKRALGDAVASFRNAKDVRRCPPPPLLRCLCAARTLQVAAWDE